MTAQRGQRPQVLLIDDDCHLLESVATLLDGEFCVRTATTGERGLAILQREVINVVLLDIRFPGMDGLEVLRRVKMLKTPAEVIMVTALRDVHMAVESIKLGASDYVTKPFENDDLLTLLRTTLARQNLLQGACQLQAEPTELPDMGNMVGRSAKMQHIYDRILRVAETQATVLVNGESGVGKELIARAIHQHSQRCKQPFIAINCAAIPEHLVESELFGYERGAFTGALEMRRGKFELADTGTLFLDEVGSLRLEAQAKLLRVLQEREFQRLGGSKTVHLDVRIIAASNRDLHQMVASNTFRMDLFYRLNVVPLSIPPLRERREDIPLLINHFVTKYSRAFQRQVEGFTPAALTMLTHYHWPGNVRELQNVIERLIALSRQRVLGVEDITSDLTVSPQAQLEDLVAREAPLRQAKDEFERRYISQALERCGWNQSETAKALGVHRNTLLSKIAQLHIQLAHKKLARSQDIS